jgi:integrase
MGKRKGMLYEALERLDNLMAIGEKRSDAKAEARARGEALFAFSDGKIHSHKTREDYQAVVMPFLHWCRAAYGLNQLKQVDARADELTSAYLQQRMDQSKSAWTLSKERPALRCFFQSRTLAEGVTLPKRRREAIVRSRHPVVQRNRHVNLDHWQLLVHFLEATGLRFEEVRDLYVRDVTEYGDGSITVQVVRGKGGRARSVPVLPGREEDVHSVVVGHSPDEHTFARVPQMEIHVFRRSYAQALYVRYAKKPLPEKRPLRLADVDREAVLKVSRALGHNRLDVVINHYLQ